MFEFVMRVFGGGASKGEDGVRKVDNLDRLLAGFDKKLGNLDQLVKPSEDAPPRTSFTSDLPREEVSIMQLSWREMLRVLPRMIPLQIRMRLGGRFYRRSFVSKRDEVSSEWVEELESMARAMGAKDIRYVKVPPQAIYEGMGVPCEYAVVFTVEMENEPLKTAPSLDCFLEVADGYSRLAKISNALTSWMRKTGVAAYPGTALGGHTDYTYLGELAGLGAIGYHGLLITPGEGARLRINTIYTNAKNLPIQKDNPHLWVRDFCSKCHKCIRKCPPQAIFEEPVPRTGGGMQCIDHKTCRDYFAGHFGCGVCLVVCPFSQAGYEKIHKQFKGAPDAPQFRIDPS
jgi:NAD-dependent dihydropyrimidine dehydrogenase PreA subunit